MPFHRSCVPVHWPLLRRSLPKSRPGRRNHRHHRSVGRWPHRHRLVLPEQRHLEVLCLDTDLPTRDVDLDGILLADLLRLHQFPHLQSVQYRRLPRQPDPHQFLLDSIDLWVRKSIFNRSNLILVFELTSSYSRHSTCSGILTRTWRSRVSRIAWSSSSSCSGILTSGILS